MSVFTRPAALAARHFWLALATSLALALVVYGGFLVAASAIAVQPPGDVAKRQARAYQYIAANPPTEAVAAIASPGAGS